MSNHTPDEPPNDEEYDEDVAIGTAQALVMQVTAPEDLDVDQRLALAQTHALISIARSLDSLTQNGLTVYVADSR